jgi:threonine synthase
VSLASRFTCGGCGAAADPLWPFRCPNAARAEGFDHVLRRELDPRALSFPAGDPETQPFLRYRTLLHSYQAARERGLSDAGYGELVAALDARVAALEGHGFTTTPFVRAAELSATLGFSDEGGVWVKDETGNVAGSHKARHLFEVMLYLAVLQRVGIHEPGTGAPLAIASCGNAALAAAVVAAAGERELQVFVPRDADEAVLLRLEELGAQVEVCDRDAAPGDPTYRRLLDALAAGALPFTCQGNLNGLAVEGGVTLAYELVSALNDTAVTLDRLVVQVGGGALASGCFEGLSEAQALGALARLPRIDTVQTRGAWPLRRAYERFLERREGHDLQRDLRAAAAARAEYMWPWEEEPRSIAHGILDDETYDWLALLEAMASSGGEALVVDEELLARANLLATELTGIPVDATGSAGLAGLLALRASGQVAEDERVAVLFTGLSRLTATASRERTRNEELPRQGHPVAQRL